MDWESKPFEGRSERNLRDHYNEGLNLNYGVGLTWPDLEISKPASIYDQKLIPTNLRIKEFFWSSQKFIRDFTVSLNFYWKVQCYWRLTDTGKVSKIVHRRIWPKVDANIFIFFPARPSDEYDSAPSRKYSRPLLDVFAFIG